MKLIALIALSFCFESSQAQSFHRRLASSESFPLPGKTATITIEKNVESPAAEPEVPAVKQLPEVPAVKQLTSDASCSAYGACNALGLADDCCPTADGVYLECCLKTCASHTACSGLDGDCCPTADGVYLDCCFQSCDVNSACAAEGLEGNCCPSNDGVYLDCCDATP